MATIYHRKDCATWFAQWSVFDTAAAKWRTKQKSTRSKDALRAQEIAEQWQKNADLVAGMVGAKRRSVRHRTAEQAPRMTEREREVLEAAMAEDPSRDPRRRAGLWTELRDATLARCKNEDTRSKYAGALARWEAHCAGHGRALRWIDDADADLAEGWRDAMLDEGLRAKRVNFCLTVAGAVYERAWRRGLVQANPFRAVGRPRCEPTRDELPAEPFDEDEVARLALAPYKVAAASRRPTDLWQAGMAEEWEVVVRLAAVAGLRMMDTLTLRWGALDLEGGTLDYLPSKTATRGRRIAFPLRYWPDLMETLRRWRETARSTEPGEPVFPLVGAAAAHSPTWASRAFVRIMDAAGIKRAVAREAAGRGRTRHSHGFHSLRHTANTRAAAMGIPAEIRKELFGHATVEQNRVYTHWRPEVLDELLNKRDRP
jgi:integrase